MGQRFWTGVAALLVSGSAVAAEDLATQAAQVFLEALSLNQSSIQTLAAGPDLECKSASDCPQVVLTVVPTYDINRKPLGCFIGSRNVVVSGAAGDRTIQFILPADPAGATYSFFKAPLVALLSSGKVVAIGSRVSEHIGQVVYNFPGKSPDVIYYPLVIQNAATSPVLCTAGDPKIINN